VEAQIYTYSRYWIAVSNLVRAMEGSLDEGDKCWFCPPLWTIYNKLEDGGLPDSSFVLGLHSTAGSTDIFWIDFALPYIGASVKEDCPWLGYQLIYTVLSLFISMSSMGGRGYEMCRGFVIICDISWALNHFN
jgi:hypothetical protein